jgi:4-hydroxy-tetrahydrodipicolinate synthase
MSAPMPRFTGSIVALVTPFKGDQVDEGTLEKLVKWHINQGTHGLVSVGTTGESPTLNHDEHRRVTELVIHHAAGKIPVIAGTGSNSTAEAIELTQHAQQAGADAALVVVPYYNKPTQEGLYAHYKAIHDACELPLILYNVPGRTVTDLSVATTGALSHLPRIIAVKDATGRVERISQQKQVCTPDFIQLSGDDILALATRIYGAKGCISVTGNVAPRLCADLQEACNRGDWETAQGIHDRLAPLHDALFLEPNPVPVKYALQRLGLIPCEDVRLPLVVASQKTRDHVDKALDYAGLI